MPIITEEEFLDIVKNHLTVGDDGRVMITNEELAIKYQDYLKHHASEAPDDAGQFGGAVVVNVGYCKVQ